MTEDQLPAYVEIIEKTLLERGSREITGAVLGEHLRRVAPNLSIRDAVGMPTGSGALSKFIESYLSSFLRPVRRSGQDIVYEITGEIATVPPKYSAAHTSAWTAFATPTSPEVVVVAKNEKYLDVAFKGANLSHAEHLTVPSVTREELETIREDFLQQVPDSELKIQIDALESSLSYADWLQRLHQISPDIYKQWAVYRRDELTKLFEQRLVALGQSGQDVEYYANLLKVAQVDANRGRLSKIAEAAPATRKIPAATLETDERLIRAVLIDSISRMTFDDIRRIQWPTGLLVDSVLRVLSAKQR